jgi:DNA repair protein RadC
MSKSPVALAPASPIQSFAVDGGLVVLPTEDTTEQDLLTALLRPSPAMACAAALLQNFPSIGHVITAEPSQLRAFGLTGHDIAAFRLVREIACRMARAEVRSRPVLGNWQALIAYLQTAMAYEQIEQFRILFLDRKNNLIADEVQQRGTVNHTPVYPREVMKRALILNASALIVVHFVARNKMRVMCPAPLCFQAQHSRCFPQLFNAARAHNGSVGFSMPPPSLFGQEVIHAGRSLLFASDR